MTEQASNFIHAQWFEAKTSQHEAFPMHLFQLNNIPQRSLRSCCVLVPCCPARSAWALVCWRMIGRDCTEGRAAFLGLFRAHASEQWPSKPYEFSSSDPSLQMETWWAGETFRLYWFQMLTNINQEKQKHLARHFGTYYYCRCYRSRKSHSSVLFLNSWSMLIFMTPGLADFSTSHKNDLHVHSWQLYHILLNNEFTSKVS